MKFEDTFGRFPMMDRENYQRLYELTGLDIDGRRECIMQHIPHMENRVCKLVNFVRAFPGYQELTQEDQIALLKSTYFIYYVAQYLNIMY